MAKKVSSKGGNRGAKGRSAEATATVSRNTAVLAALVAAGLAFVIGYVVGTGRGAGGEGPRAGAAGDGASHRPRRAEPEEAAAAEPVEVPRNAEGPGLGPADAPVLVAEFFDFQCPACRSVPPELHKLHDAFPREVRIEFRMFPLPFHKAARPLAEIALAAHEQGKYVEVADRLFEKQGLFSGADQARARSLGLELAAEVEGVDADRLRRDLESGRLRGLVDRDFALGEQVGLRATPTIYIQGKVARGRSFERLREQVEEALAAAP